MRGLRYMEGERYREMLEVFVVPRLLELNLSRGL